ncbi:exonuclease SbcCD subunit D [Zhihengliuella sp.]|uniref:exonuclease SbcCD subunit D n=1 Tax=Zhihengliuella sp. TaxID=1954483 RepID=UPI00281192FE|nr:exonuclease SbcCD subunit D [Zhihengliuella sp.]
MKLLHTSDWHLGRSFHEEDMLPAQRGFVDQLVDLVRAEGIDVVLVAGDVYDQAMPRVDVIRVFDDALVRLRRAGAEIVVTSGNHDSAVRLGVGSSFMAFGGLHVRTEVTRAWEPVVFPADGHQVAVYPVPYLEPRLVRDGLGVSDPGHTPVAAEVLDRIWADLDERRTTTADPVVGIVMAHVFASGGAGSESERPLSVGGLDVVPTSLFERFDYAALGHLHGRQVLAPGVRYSGSPLHYSFSEAGHTKGAWLLRTGADRSAGSTAPVEVEGVDWRAHRPLRRLSGPIDELLGASEYAEAEGAYCQITLTDAERPARALSRLKERFPHVLQLIFAPADGAARQSTYAQRVGQGRPPLEVSADFLAHVRQRSANGAERGELERLVEAALTEAATA